MASVNYFLCINNCRGTEASLIERGLLNMNAKRWWAIGIAIFLFVASTGITAMKSLMAQDFSGQLTSLLDESEEETLFEEKTVASGNLDSRIAVLTVDGTIQDTGDSASLLSSETYNHQAFLEQLQQVKDDETVKGIILKINSPGGGVIESKQIYEAIKAIQKDRKIPVYSSMGSMAASGGYYISAPADKIFADEETMTGSIGVIMQGVNYSKLAEKYGIEFETIKTGPYKDIMSGSREMTKDERKILQDMVNESYNRFLNVIADGRDMSKADVKKLADGRIYSGSQAKKVGLVDELGYEEDAIASMKKDYDLKNAEVFEYTASSDWTSMFAVKVNSILSGSADSQIIGKLLANYNSAPRMMYLYGEE